MKDNSREMIRNEFRKIGAGSVRFIATRDEVLEFIYSRMIIDLENTILLAENMKPSLEEHNRKKDYSFEYDIIMAMVDIKINEAFDRFIKKLKEQTI